MLTGVIVLLLALLCALMGNVKAGVLNYATAPNTQSRTMMTPAAPRAVPWTQRRASVPSRRQDRTVATRATTNDRARIFPPEWSELLDRIVPPNRFHDPVFPKSCLGDHTFSTAVQFDGALRPAEITCFVSPNTHTHLLGECSLQLWTMSLGYMEFDMNANDALNIIWIENLSEGAAVKGVGRSLVSAAYELSLKCGLEGRMEAAAVPESLEFFRRLGFTPARTLPASADGGDRWLQSGTTRHLRFNPDAAASFLGSQQQ
jgi:hypothetical protein